MTADFKLILADNDGTLVDDARVLSPRTKAALEALHEKGYLFGLSSGRAYDDVKEYPEKWGLSFDFDVCVCLNGSQLYDGLTGDLYQWNYLDEDTVREILELIIPYGANPWVSDGIGGVIWEIDDETRKSQARNKSFWVKIADSIDDMVMEAPKILVRMSEEEMVKFEEFLAQHPSDKYRGYKTQPTVYEFVHVKADKAYAIEEFCRIHDMDPMEILTFGDTSNDNGMLAYTYGVCMANGSADTKAVSKEITKYTNNEDGLAIYLEETILKSE